MLLLCFTDNQMAKAQFFGFGMGGQNPYGMHSRAPHNSTSKGENAVPVESLSTNLPIVIINTKGGTINAEKKIPSHMQIIDNGKGRRNSFSDPKNHFDGPIEIKLRGNSSLSFEQKRYTLETVNQQGKKLDVELLGMPADNDWVLLAPYNDISMMRDVFAFQLWRDMGYWAPRTRYVELVVDDNYRGVYILTEKIKRSANRLDIAKLKPTDNEGLELTGGYIMRIDAYDSHDKTFVSKIPGIINYSASATPMGGVPFGGMGGAMGGFGAGGNRDVVWSYYSPKDSKISPQQAEYIHGYIDLTEQVIMSDDYADTENGYAKYIKVSSFVDYFIHTELSLNADGFKRSAYFYKTKQNADGTGGKLHAGPVWDYNLAYGNCNFCNANNPRAWVHEGGETSPTPAMWKRLTTDARFMDRVKKRWSELRKGPLSLEHIYQFIDNNAALLDEAQIRQYRRYPDLLVSEGGNGSGRHGAFPLFGGGMQGNGISWFAAYRVSSYAEEIETLKLWFKQRIEFLDSQWR